jgi:hypothetical protein
VDSVHEEAEDVPVHRGQFSQQGKYQGGRQCHFSLVEH